MPRSNDKVSRDSRSDDALYRLNQRATRSPQEQLQELDTRLGMGVGATKERARLEARL